MNKLAGISLYIEKTGQFSRNAKLVLFYSALSGLAFGVARFLSNFYVLSLGPDYDQAFLGTLQTAASFATILMALPAAYLAERYSQKKVMILSGLASSLSLLGLVLLPSKLFLILFLMGISMAASVGQVAMAPFLMANTSPEVRQWVFSFNFGLVTIASFLGNLLGGLLPTWLGGFFHAAPTASLSYQLTLGCMMIVALVSVFPLIWTKTQPSDPQRRLDLPWIQTRRYARQLSKYLIPQLIIGLGAGLMMPFMNIYFRSVYDRPDPSVAAVFAIGGLAMALAQFIGPPLADHYGKIQTVILTQALSVPFLITLGVGTWAAVNRPDALLIWFFIAAIAYIFRLALMNLSNPVYQTFVLEQVPESTQALAMSLSNLSFQFGWFVMPQASGWLQVRYGDLGFVPIFFAVSAFYITAILLEWRFFRYGRHARSKKFDRRPAVADR